MAEPTDASAGGATETGDAGSLARARAAIAANPMWYHTIDLAPGVSTPGQIDLRRVPPRLLPGDLSGRRALDVGTFDGFWAFEMERRGAQVVGTDVERLDAADWPPHSRARLEATAREWKLDLGLGFRLAAEALDSRVRRVECNVYELEPAAVGGPVEFAFSGAILLHLRDPVRALERIRATIGPGGTLVMFEPFSVMATARAPRRPVAQFNPLRTNFEWWLPNLSALHAYLLVAGFDQVRRIGVFHPRAAWRKPWDGWYVGLTARRPGAPA